MRFDTPAGSNPVDRQKVLGQPVERIEGHLKTTGRATYAYEQHVAAPNAAYGFIVGAGVAKGVIEAMHIEEASACPGVLAVITYANSGSFGPASFIRTTPLAGPEVSHYHQAVAFVVAESFEQARDAASHIHIEYRRQDGRYDLAEQFDSAAVAPPYMLGPSESRINDFDTAFAQAPFQLDETYTTPAESHQMMEPQATLAAWSGDELTCWTSTQGTGVAAGDLAATLGVPREKVRVIAPFVGGGFGSKSFIHADVILAALGARAIGRPVKVAMQRPLIANNTTHRPSTIQRIRLGATADGTITAIGHEALFGNVANGWQESAVVPTRHLYAGANRLTVARMATLDLPEGSTMRAPCEATGMMALEVAMDEMAEKLGMDPVEFRVRNDTQESPEHAGRKFSLRQLEECFREGASRFGWSERKAEPRAVREGRWYIGMGTASAIRGALAFPSSARVRLAPDGLVTVESDMTDIGTGSYTIIAQTAAEMMGVPVEQVAVVLGDSSLPATPGSGGQYGAASSTAGVYAACVKLRELVTERLGLPADAEFVDGTVRTGDQSVPLATAASDGELVVEDFMEYGDLFQTFDQQSFGAHFVKVAVDVDTGEVRVRNTLTVCAAGRILNPITARSQIIGGMTMGVGAALMEELVVDKRYGFFVNHDLASYEVPVHADIQSQEVVFLDEADPYISPLKAKGIGELGISGAAAAVANAIYNATGVRVRHYPVTLDKYLAQLPNVA